MTTESTNPIPYCVIGFGIAGQLLVLELLEAKVSPADIVVVDQTFSGGDLALAYSAVLSNTPWFKTRKALSKYSIAAEAIADGDSLYAESDYMPVRDIARLCWKAAWKAAQPIRKVKTTVLHLDYTDVWSVQHTYGSLTAKTVFLATGGTPKELDLSTPTIPLHVALTPALLTSQVTPKDHVVVFGTSHSGTLILETLHKAQVPTTVIYKGSKPFQFESDGAYSGLKAHSETIAREAMNGSFTIVTLVPWTDPIGIHKALSSATRVIYAIGFEPRCVDGLREYSPETAKLKGERLYGFGLAYPGVSVLDGSVHQDVSVLSFQDQIQRCLPAALL